MKNKILITLLIIFISLYIGIHYLNNNTICSIQKVDNMYNQALINTYLNNIKTASNEFYADYFTKSPSVMYYTVSVKQVISEKSNSVITFISNPYLGPHDPIGIDKITFIADYMGNIELKEFKHLVTYHLPENLKHLEKSLMPGKYE